MTNHDASQVGVPYVRCNRLIINYPDAGQTPSVSIEQCLAVKLADGTVRALEALPAINAVLDFSKATEPVPLVNPNDATPLGANTTLQQVFVGVLAIVRQEQNKAEQAAA
jgi:hypothetical protein